MEEHSVHRYQGRSHRGVAARLCKGGKCRGNTSQMEYREKLWRLLDVMLTRHLRDDKLDVRKVFQNVILGLQVL